MQFNNLISNLYCNLLQIIRKEDVFTRLCWLLLLCSAFHFTLPLFPIKHQKGGKICYMEQKMPPEVISLFNKHCFPLISIIWGCLERCHITAPWIEADLGLLSLWSFPFFYSMDVYIFLWLLELSPTSYKLFILRCKYVCAWCSEMISSRLCLMLPIPRIGSGSNMILTRIE